MKFIDKLQRFKIFQHSFKEPAAFYSHLTLVPNLVAKLSGMDVFSPDYQIPNVFGAITLVLLLLYFFINTTSAYELRQSTEDLINCWVTIGIAFQGASKLLTFTIFRKRLVSLHHYTEKLYQEECNPRTRALLTDNVFLLSVVLKAMLVCYAFTSFALDFAPLLVLAYTGERILPFGFHLPLIDRFSLVGYTVNYLLQIILTVLVSSTDMGPDCIYMILSMNSFTQIDLLMESLKDVSRRVEENDIQDDIGIKKIIKRHQEHLHYLRQVETVFRVNFFVTFVSLSSVLVLSLFAVVTLSWYQGIMFIVFVSYQLFFGCFLGTYLAIKNEQLQQEIYNIPWYKLSVENQKLIRFLLEATQKPICLTLVFAPLTMPTFLQVYKTIYSIFTMLLTVRDD